VVVVVPRGWNVDLGNGVKAFGGTFDLLTP
jgi:hypothetical protein